MGKDFSSALRPAIVMTLLFAAFLGIVYPLAMTGIGQLLFPAQANGSLVRNAAGTVIGSAVVGQAFTTALNQVYGQRVTIEWADTQGLDVTSAGQLEPRVRTWYNPDKSSSDFLIPGLIVVIIMVVALSGALVFTYGL